MSEKPKILVVDDNPSNVMVVQFLLEDLDLDSDSATSGTQAMEMLKEGEYQLVLLDWMMPGMDGMQVLERVKEIPELGDLKVVLCTAKETKEDQREAFNRGAAAFLSKPLTAHGLRGVLRKLGFVEDIVI